MVEEVTEQSQVTQLHQQTEPVDSPGSINGVSSSLQESDVEENQVSDDELGDLQEGDALGDGGGTLDLAGGQEVVTVHDGVDTEV